MTTSTGPTPSYLPTDVSKRKESLKLIYSPSIHWLGAITVLCILGIAASSFVPQGTAMATGLATIAGISVGALAKLMESNSQGSQPTQTSQTRQD